MDIYYFKQRHELLRVKYQKEKELFFKAQKEEKPNEERVHFGNMKYLEGQMQTIIDICEGRYGQVIGTTR